MGSDPVSQLNANCFCVSVDPVALRQELDSDGSTRGLYDTLLTTHAHLYAQSPVFVARRDFVAMRELVAAVESVVALPAYRDAALAWAPDVARFDPGTRGVLMGYDFHLSESGPRLIEINTNAGGAFFNAALSRAQRACCAEVLEALDGTPAALSETDVLMSMFLEEWGLARGTATLRRVAIVDDKPEQQYLYPEFLLAARSFEARGIEAVICDPQDLELADGRLCHASGPVDLVYNRLTDFPLELPQHALLRDAYLGGLVSVTPHPRAHALYADKRNLSLLCDAAGLARWGAGSQTIETLVRAVPRTVIVSRAHEDELWAARRRLFFKPASGYGAKASYRGDKLTRRAWSEILQAPYVAQEIVPPSERSVRLDDESARLKLDVRCYAYGGRVLMLAARLYQGQTTNFRTPGGGFATVYIPKE